MILFTVFISSRSTAVGAICTPKSSSIATSSSIAAIESSRPASNKSISRSSRTASSSQMSSSIPRTFSSMFTVAIYIIPSMIC